jgi:hypothetical protein
MIGAKTNLIFRYTILVSYAFFCCLMLEITLQYRTFETDVAFLSIKQDYIGLSYYRVAFFTHVCSAIFVLIAGFTQFSKKIRSSYRRVHVISGRIYVYATLIFAAPSGFVIGLFANGGLSSRVAFCLLAVLWWFFTWKGNRAAVKKDFNAHRDFMIRSFALAVSAITLRAWKYLLVACFAPKPMDVYRIVAWLGWALNLVLAEIIIYKLYKSRYKLLTKTIQHEN